VLYAVRNEIVHVHSASVLRFPAPPVEQSRPRATADYEALPEAANARRDVGRRSFN
jgi:hypothetical protein